MSEINKIIRELWRNTYRGNGKDQLFPLSSNWQLIVLKTNEFNVSKYMYWIEAGIL